MLVKSAATRRFIKIIQVFIGIALGGWTGGEWGGLSGYKAQFTSLTGRRTAAFYTVLASFHTHIRTHREGFGKWEVFFLEAEH